METKNITVLGSTGSIGTQTLEIAEKYGHIKIRAISANSNIKLLEEQARKFKPDIAAVVNEKKAEELKIALADTPVKVIGGKQGITAAAEYAPVDTVVTALVGIAGLEPTIAAIKAGKDIALANKETLVTAGHIVTRLAREKGVKLLPVDSEHSAVFQSMLGNNKKRVKRILLTASGGPFFGKKTRGLG